MRKSGTPDQSPEDHRRDPVPEDRGAPVRTGPNGVRGGVPVDEARVVNGVSETGTVITSHSALMRITQ